MCQGERLHLKCFENCYFSSDECTFSVLEFCDLFENRFVFKYFLGRTDSYVYSAKDSITKEMVVMKLSPRGAASQLENEHFILSKYLNNLDGIPRIVSFKRNDIMPPSNRRAYRRKSYQQQAGKQADRK